jgi:hypothetical protein
MRACIVDIVFERNICTQLWSTCEYEIPILTRKSKMRIRNALFGYIRLVSNVPTSIDEHTFVVGAYVEQQSSGVWGSQRFFPSFLQASARVDSFSFQFFQKWIFVNVPITAYSGINESRSCATRNVQCNHGDAQSAMTLHSLPVESELRQAVAYMLAL